MLKIFNFAVVLAGAEIFSRFRTSRLGIHWFYIQQLVWAFGAGIVWSIVFGIPLAEFLPFIIISFTSWNLIAGLIIDSSALFVNSAGYLKNIKMSPYGYILKLYIVHSILYLFGLAPFLIIQSYLDVSQILVGFVIFVPSFAVLMVALFPILLLLALLGVWVRDLTPALQSFFQVLFVASPVIYPPDLLIKKGFTWVLDINPFYYLLEVVRKPMLNGEAADPLIFVVIIVLSAIFGIIFYLYFRKAFARVALNV